MALMSRRWIGDNTGSAPTAIRSHVVPLQRSQYATPRYSPPSLFGVDPQNAS